MCQETPTCNQCEELKKVIDRVSYYLKSLHNWSDENVKSATNIKSITAHKLQKDQPKTSKAKKKEVEEDGYRLQLINDDLHLEYALGRKHPSIAFRHLLFTLLGVDYYDYEISAHGTKWSSPDYEESNYIYFKSLKEIEKLQSLLNKSNNVCRCRCSCNC